MKRLVLGVSLFLVGSLPRVASADVLFGFACTSNCYPTGDAVKAPAGFMLEIAEQAPFEFDSGGFWPEFLWEIESTKLAYHSAPDQVFSVAGNTFSGWDGVVGGGHISSYATFDRLLLSRDLSVAPLRFQLGNLVIWSDPSHYPLTDAVHDVWSMAYADDLSRVSTGVLLRCRSEAECLDSTLHVPEPSTLGLVALGLIAAALRRRRAS